MSALPALSQSDAVVVAFPRCATADRLVSSPPLDEASRIELDRLRWLALRARLAPKPDLERACFLLAGRTEASLERYSVAFFRGLSDHALREMVFYRPGTRPASDDEIWLLRLMTAWRCGRERAAGALVAWRVCEPQRRWMRFLSSGLARALDERS